MLSSTLVAGLLLASGQLPWEAGLRTEGWATDGAGDLDLIPSVGLGYEERDLVAHLRYEPRFVLKTPSSRGTFDAMQVGSITGDLRLDPETRLHAAQDLSVGSMDLSWPSFSSSAPPSSITRQAGSPSVRMLNANSSVVLDYALSRRTHLAATSGYSVAGGLGEGLATVPRTHSVGLGATGTWVERRDALSFAVSGSRGWVSTSETTWLLGASSSWRHALSQASELALTGEQPPRIGQRGDPRYETEISGGVAGTGRSGAAGYRLDPTASLALRRDEPALRAGSLAALVMLRYAPTLDLATGELRPRYEMSARVDLRLDRQLVCFAASAVAITREPDPPLPDVIVQGGVGLEYQLVAGVVISASGRVAKLSQVEWTGVITTTIMRSGRL